MGYTHFSKVAASELAVGQKGSEVKIADSTGVLYIQGTAITATAAELNAAAGTGVSSTELSLLDGALAGTAVANKALALGADKNVDTLVIADSGLKLGAGAGTAVTATAAQLNVLATVTATATEINTVDASINVETLVAPGAVSITMTNSKLALAGAGAVTLAAPGADMLGRIKQIEMTVDNGDVTLALTNVDGGTAGTTATFNDVNDSLVLVGGTNKWHVIAEAGVVLS